MCFRVTLQGRKSQISSLHPSFQDHFRSKYNRETLKALSGKYRAEAARQEFGSAVLRFCVDQYCPFLKSQYLFLYGIPSTEPNILTDHGCAVGGPLTMEEKMVSTF